MKPHMLVSGVLVLCSPALLMGADSVVRPSGRVASITVSAGSHVTVVCVVGEQSHRIARTTHPPRPHSERLVTLNRRTGSRDSRGHSVLRSDVSERRDQGGRTRVSGTHRWGRMHVIASSREVHTGRTPARRPAIRVRR